MEIPGEERDCQVYFLLKKKSKRVESTRKKSKEPLSNKDDESATDAIKFEDEEESTDNPTYEEK